MPVSRPRARTLEGNQVQLATYATFADDELLNQVVLERMLVGLATRRHQAAAEPVGHEVEQQATSTSKSSVSRRFVKATARQVAKLLGRSLTDGDVAVLMIDGARVRRPLLCGGIGDHRRWHQGPGRAVAGRHREHHGGDRAAGRSGRPRP